MIVDLGRPITVALLLTTITVALLFLSPANASYSIQIEDGVVGVNISADLRQGVPSASVNEVELFGSLPSFTVKLTPENASMMTEALNHALGANSPSAAASQVTFSAASNGTSVHYDLHFRVGGVFISEKGEEKVDLAWRAFVTPDELKVDGFTVNRLVPTYLGPEIDLLAQKGLGGTLQQFRWYLNDRSRLPSQISSDVANLVLFNFTSLNSPLEDWTISRDIDPPSTQLSSSTGFNLTFVERINDPTDPFAAARNLVYGLSVSIDAPWEARPSGDELRLGGSFPNEQLMLSIMLVAGALLIGTVVAERRVQKARSPRRSRKEKNWGNSAKT